MMNFGLMINMTDKPLVFLFFQEKKSLSKNVAEYTDLKQSLARSPQRYSLYSPKFLEKD